MVASGFAGLGYQIVWTQQSSLWLGPDAAAVLSHVSKGQGNEIGLGATTVIIEGESIGLKFVGPLPEDIQNYTAYAATLAAEGAGSNAAREFVSYLTTPVAKQIFAAAGIK